MEPAPLAKPVVNDNGPYDYDLLVIGSGPAGHHAALEAAKNGQRVALIDRCNELGGVCLHTGTIPSKTLREAALYLSGFRQRSFYGRGYRVKAKIQIQDLMFRASEVINGSSTSFRISFSGSVSICSTATRPLRPTRTSWRWRRPDASRSIPPDSSSLLAARARPTVPTCRSRPHRSTIPTNSSR